ncbi:MAG: hypothetical protein J5767_15145, partial [Paludibacteraceae bacterium]|nr:hypothetical protein [Paludibacteraceae bacterium]
PCIPYLILSFSKFFYGLILAGVRIFFQVFYVIDPDFIFVFGIKSVDLIDLFLSYQHLYLTS